MTKQKTSVQQIETNWKKPWFNFVLGFLMGGLCVALLFLFLAEAGYFG